LASLVSEEDRKGGLWPPSSSRRHFKVKTEGYLVIRSPPSAITKSRQRLFPLFSIRNEDAVLLPFFLLAIFSEWDSSAAL